jgi:predicted nucleotidyltransferase component of viral defense system
LKDSPFFKQAELLLRILPYIDKERDFALKGGTALNFFIRELPRLSVDIDLCYLPVNDRDSALTEISESLDRISTTIEKSIPDLRSNKTIDEETGLISSLIVQQSGFTVKVEPNPVVRGSVFPSQLISLSKKAQNIFETSVAIQVLSLEDLFGNKICAALDRQHPRDLFDVKLLLENEGITDRTRRAFLIYLISHPRPMVELLNPNPKDIQSDFTGEFLGMTLVEIKLEELSRVREQLIKQINESLAYKEKKFLLSFKKMEPDWELLELDGVEKLPAVKWKLFNLEKMGKKKHGAAVEKLKKHLQL